LRDAPVNQHIYAAQAPTLIGCLDC